jgi:hypothetical protein
MAYSLNPAQDVMAIAEQQFGSGEEIRFTSFTSCIGVIARKGNQVTGIHLVMLSQDDTPFNDDAATLTIETLGNYTQVVVIGQIEMWEDNFREPYQTLINGLNNPMTISQNDGDYGGRVNGQGRFQIYENGKYSDVTTS